MKLANKVFYGNSFSRFKCQYSSTQKVNSKSIKWNNPESPQLVNFDKVLNMEDIT